MLSPPNRLDVFVRGEHNDDLVQWTWDKGQWSGWKNLNYRISSAPAVAPIGSRLTIFARGAPPRGEGRLIQTWLDVQ